MNQDHAGYNPDQYWENRGGPSYREYTESAAYAQYHHAQHEFFTNLIAQLKPQCLLDFGCGTGKLFPIWTGVSEVHAYDRSQSQIEEARRAASRIRPENPYKVLHYVAPQRGEVPYDDDYFDLVVVAEVLLHVLPEDIGGLLDELRRICRGHLAVVTAAPFTNAAAHCFDHNYPALFMGRFDLIDDHAVLRQRYLVGRKIGAASVSRPQTFNLEPRTSDAILTA
ncbi:MAG: class I SAM-dependent methyltransferase [candidate division Zixibacteria bacterium]|nr:class I SAM-dependent methyltransferase [candidate division Zixibacteria bacterium]